MKFTNVRELKAKTSDILKKVESGENVVITYHGKPKALLSKISEEEIKLIRKICREKKVTKEHPFFRLLGIFSDDSKDLSENKYNYVAKSIDG
ncbi:MAG: hypothetical protein CMD96_06145 [Gammaproteobacteria bacterium]|jgi:prevent-host-death family protein|nr:hypothetical protein [Gammaproteobacteria bacterium]HJP17632.1 type II toxin-antitoxin system prevent-host-death family antitoxin [Nitrospinota bacterium]|tara:strand:+ start:2254 stop:2532 length:279 start_codon:yes stop_codon:yes gene_type:complete